jgi:ribosomal protein S18 acetylase RimI-like enzyme
MVNEISYKKISGPLTEDQFSEYLKIEEAVFGECLELTSTKQRCSRKDFFLLLAYVGNDVVGFKSGYSEKLDQFYSWTGGVHPDFRKRGIAEKLMTLQHQSLKEMGYAYVTTKSQNDFKPMKS